MSYLLRALATVLLGWLIAAEPVIAQTEVEKKPAAEKAPPVRRPSTRPLQKTLLLRRLVPKTLHRIKLPPRNPLPPQNRQL
jgi:hypothetical protein